MEAAAPLAGGPACNVPGKLPVLSSNWMLAYWHSASGSDYKVHYKAHVSCITRAAARPEQRRLSCTAQTAAPHGAGAGEQG